MNKNILDLVNDFNQWRGNPFTLANLIIDLQNQNIRQKLIDAGEDNAAGIV
jgi:hypothetical protein